MTNSDFDVVPSLSEYTEHILYACKIVNAKDSALEYSMGILSETNFKRYEEKMEYLKQYSGDSQVKDLMEKVGERIEEFKKSIESRTVES